MSKTCPFSDLFGNPREGVHSVRIPVLDIAFVDTALTFIVAWFLQKTFFRETPYITVLVLFALLGEFLHIIFCVKTPVRDLLV